MIVACPSCDRKYKFSEDKLGKRGAKITCPKCRHVFVVYKDREIESLGRKNEDGTIEADDRTERPPPPRNPWPRDFPTWSFRELGATWQVRKQAGLTYTFESLDELQGFLDELQVSRSDEISVDGRQWVQISDFADLTAYFYDVWKRIEAGDIVFDEDAEEEEDDADAPTTIMGAGSSLADEIRRAVQDTLTPAPAAERIRATPRPPTPRGTAPRAMTPGTPGAPSGFLSPPPASGSDGPSWGGPVVGSSDPQNEDETVGRFMTRMPASTPTPYGGRSAPTPPSVPRTRQPAFADEPLPPPPRPIDDPFSALGGSQARPQESAQPASTAPEADATENKGSDPLEAVLAVLAGLAFVFMLYIYGIKSGMVPVSMVPFEVPRLLLPDEAQTQPVVSPAPAPSAAVDGQDTPTPEELEAGAPEEGDLVTETPSGTGDAEVTGDEPLAVPTPAEEASPGEARSAPAEAGE